MLIIITANWEVHNEAQKINQLFEEGLECLHFRKPNWNKNQWVGLLSQIEIKFHNKIMLHDYHELTQQFQVKGVHLKEKHRNQIQNLKQYVIDFRQKGFQVSTGFHSLEAIHKNKFLNFDYVFLSPVFDSISKDNYSGKSFDVNGLDNAVYALGGIDKMNLNQVKNLGYTGAAVLGSVWKSEEEIQVFKNLVAN